MQAAVRARYDGACTAPAYPNRRRAAIGPGRSLSAAGRDRHDGPEVARHPRSKGRRLWDLASLTAKVATRNAVTKVATLFADEEAARKRIAEGQAAAGRAMAETLGRLKGAAMKVGQMASTAMDFLPGPVTEALATLQRGAPPLAWDEMRPWLESQLGVPIAETFASIEEAPFAAASIGQVHRARLADGRAVVLKIQYPGMDESMESDLAMLRISLRAGGFVRIDPADLDRVFEEIRDRLLEEMDYLREAENLATFRTFHAGDPEVVVPEPIRELCRRRVLVMSDEPAMPLKDFADADPPPELRDRVGTTLARVLGDQLFRLQRIQTDPNPANYGVRDDGRVVLYDFGSVKEIPDDFLSAYRDAIAAGLRRDFEALEQALVALGARRTDRPAPRPDLYPTWTDILAEPFESQGPYDFGATRLHERVAAELPRFLSEDVGAFRPPPDLVFVDRAVVGLFANLRMLRAKVDVGALLRERLGRAVPTPGGRDDPAAP